MMAAGRVKVCRECDWTMELPRLARGESAHCPRCAHKVAQRQTVRADQVLAWSIAALVMLGLSLLFPLIHLQVQGVTHSIMLLDVPRALIDDPFVPVGLTVALCTVVLPGAYLLILVYLSVGRLARQRLPGMATLAVLSDSIRPWAMSDVFIFGVLISLIKLVTLARVELGPAFFTFCAYAVALLVVLTRHDPARFWRWLAGTVPAPDAAPGRPAAEQDYAGCAVCEAVFRRLDRAACPRCRHRAPRPPNRQQQATWALIVTAAVLLVPAMTQPVMAIDRFGYSDPQTVVGGAWYLARTGSWPIALVIFLASVVVPIGKMLALGWLCIRSQRPAVDGRHERARLYRLTELIGRWSMIDVFVVAVLVALVQMHQIMRIEPGTGVIAFGALVIVTMLAAMTFDPRALWLAPAPGAESRQ